MNCLQVFSYFSRLLFGGLSTGHRRHGFAEYMEQVQSAASYDTGITSEYGHSLLALFTCRYHTKNGGSSWPPERCNHRSLDENILDKSHLRSRCFQNMQNPMDLPHISILRMMAYPAQGLTAWDLSA